MDDKSKKILNTGGKAELVHTNHDRSKLYISNFNNILVHIIDTEKDVIIKDIKGLEGPEEAVVSKSGKVLYIVNFNSSKVLTFDTDSFEK